MSEAGFIFMKFITAVLFGLLIYWLMPTVDSLLARRTFWKLCSRKAGR